MAEITQEKAAEVIGVSRQTVNAWVKSGELSGATIERIKTALQIDLTLNYDKELSQNRNITQKANVNPLLTNEYDFSDVERPNHNFGHTENSTYPERGKSTSNEWKDLYFLQQEQIRLLTQQVEILNKIVMQQ